MSEGSEVTFVNGIAAEQTTEGESNIPEGERAEAIAAVKEALKKEGETAAKETKESLDKDPLRKGMKVDRDEETGKFKPKADEKAEPQEEDEHALKRVLRERKQIAARQAEVNAQFQKQAQELRQMEYQIRQEREALNRDRKFVETLKADPARAFKEAGWDPEEAILHLAREGTPEGAQERQMRAFQAKVKEMEDWKAAQEEARVKQQEDYKQQVAAKYREQVEREFLAISLDEEKHPHIASYYKGHEASLINEGDLIARQYRQLTGKEATFEDIAEYLEERQANWYKSRSTPGQQVQSPVTKSKGQSTPGSVTGRSLNSEVSSERRSLGTKLKDLDGDDRLAAAREAVASAIHASGERQ